MIKPDDQVLHNDSEFLEVSDYVLGDFAAGTGCFLPGGTRDGAGLGGYLHVGRGQVQCR